MRQCDRCGQETWLNDDGVPICFRCDDLPQLERSTIVRLLRHNLESAIQRRQASIRVFQEALQESWSEIPVADGALRIQQASREFQDALKAVSAANRMLNDFLVKGTIPAGADLRADVNTSDKESPG